AAETAALPGKTSRRKLLAAGIAVVVSAGVVATLWFGAFRGSKDDLGRFQGEWAITANGRSDIGTIRVEGDRWTYVVGGLERKSYRLTLKPEASPKEIDLAQLGEDGRPVTFTHGTGKGSEVKLHGVYSFDGDTARVILAPGIEPRPLSFDTDTDAQVLNLTRVKK
ncbi:MAG: hypothetical protein JWO38_3836, partial [Gemmataceae bacterium]|nr:hypothetical protein [Gemmataceae bacterium]